VLGQNEDFPRPKSPDQVIKSAPLVIIRGDPKVSGSPMSSILPLRLPSWPRSFTAIFEIGGRGAFLIQINKGLRQ
jgi:hypothetical protein